MRNSPTAYQNFPLRSTFAYGNKNPKHGRSSDQCPNQSFARSDENRSPNRSFNNQNGNWRNNGNFSGSPTTQLRDFSQNNSCRQQRNDQSNISAFCRSDNRPTTGFSSYEQKFLQNKNETSSKVVRFTTIHDTINDLSELYWLNYQDLRTRRLINLRVPDLTPMSSTLPPETPKMIVVWWLILCWIQVPLA